jgi:hypothetical protein
MKISASRMPGTRSAIQRGTAHAVSCTRDVLCDGEEADGCCATKQSFMPVILAEAFSLIRKDPSLIASSTEFETQSVIIEMEGDMPTSQSQFGMGANEPDR